LNFRGFFCYTHTMPISTPHQLVSAWGIANLLPFRRFRRRIQCWSG